MEATISPMVWGLVFRKTDKLEILTYVRHKDEPSGTGHPADGIEVPCGVADPRQAPLEAMVQRLKEKVGIVDYKTITLAGTIVFPLKEEWKNGSHNTHIYLVDVTGIKGDFMPQGKYLEKINREWGAKWVTKEYIDSILKGQVEIDGRKVRLNQPLAWAYILTKV